jgi:hypothetical protein
MKKLLFVFTLSLSFLAIAVSAQPRPVDKKADEKVIAPAPASFEARYEGGMLGYSKKEKGTLKFDDVNERIVFYGKTGKEIFAIAYDAIYSLSPQSQSVRSTTETVVGAIPLPGAGLAGMFIKEKLRYLIIQYSDRDADLNGVTSFKIENKDLLDSVIKTLGEKAELRKRGDAYFRSRSSSIDDNDDN